jgi:hypothetical protein
MTAKIQKSSDLGDIWYYYRHDRVKNWALIISCYVLTLFFIHTTSTCIVCLGDICNALCYSNHYFNLYFHEKGGRVLVATPRCMFLVSLFWRWDVVSLT